MSAAPFPPQEADAKLRHAVATGLSAVFACCPQATVYWLPTDRRCAVLAYPRRYNKEKALPVDARLVGRYRVGTRAEFVLRDLAATLVEETAP